MKVLVYEYLSAGDIQDPHEEKITAEGEYMLSRLLQDFLDGGGISTITALHQRILEKYGTAADKFFPAGKIYINPRVGGKSRSEIFASLLREVDCVLLIAPESNGSLAEFTELVERKGIGNMGATLDAVTSAGDKWLSYIGLTQNRYPVPPSRLFSPNDPFKGEMFEFPVVIKPRLGAGGELFFLKNLRELKDRLREIQGLFGNRELILQQFRPGLSASVSAVGKDGEALPLSLNLQSIDRSAGFSYKGGKVGIRHPLRERVFEKVKTLPSIFPGLKGYFGVDILLRDEDFDIVEINPRLTSSYLGLSLESEVKPLKYIIAAARGTNLPSSPPRVKETDFSISPEVFER